MNLKKYILLVGSIFCIVGGIFILYVALLTKDKRQMFIGVVCFILGITQLRRWYQGNKGSDR